MPSVFVKLQDAQLLTSRAQFQHLAQIRKKAFAPVSLSRGMLGAGEHTFRRPSAERRFLGARNSQSELQLPAATARQTLLIPFCAPVHACGSHFTDDAIPNSPQHRNGSQQQATCTVGAAHLPEKRMLSVVAVQLLSVAIAFRAQRHLQVARFEVCNGTSERLKPRLFARSKLVDSV